MNYLVDLRTKANLTQQELAERARVGKSTIVKIEAGHIQPRRATCVKLAEVLGVTPGHLAQRLARDAARPAVPPTPEAGSASLLDIPAEQLPRVLVIASLSDAGMTGDAAEAVAFLALVSLFRARLGECLLRPEAYQGYVAAARQLFEHAEHIGRALRAEEEANWITNGELDIVGDPVQLRTALTGYRRWEGCHRQVLHAWAGQAYDPAWQDTLDDSAAHWEQRLDEGNAGDGQASVARGTGRGETA